MTQVPPTARAESAPAIRAARQEDAHALAPLLAQLGYPADPDAIRKRLGRLLGDSSNFAIVAVDSDQVVGFASLHLFHVVHDDAPVALITALVVAENARGKGAGRALVEALEQLAVSRQCRRIVVTSAERRADAHAFYLRLGYDYTGRRFGRRLDATGRAG